MTTETTSAPAPTTIPDLSPEGLAALQVLADASTEGPWFLSDCEGELIVLPEQDLPSFERGEDGRINWWRMPTSWRPERRILDITLDSWDQGENKQDDQIRANARFITEARTAVPALIALVREQAAAIARVRKLANDTDAISAQLGKAYPLHPMDVRTALSPVQFWTTDNSEAVAWGTHDRASVQAAFVANGYDPAPDWDDVQLAWGEEHLPDQEVWDSADYGKEPVPGRVPFVVYEF